MEGVRWVDSSGALRSALESKASRYGRLNFPYIIAVDGLSEWDFPADDLDIEQALLGTRGSQLKVNPTTKQTDLRETRSSDGFWSGPQGPQHPRASAVLVASLLMPFTLGAVNAVLWHNPWAAHPLDPAL